MEVLIIILFVTVVILNVIIVWLNAKIDELVEKNIALLDENKDLKEKIFILEDNMIIVGLEGNILLDIAFEDETCESVIKKMELKEYLHFGVLEYLPDNFAKVKYELVVWKRKKDSSKEQKIK